MRTSELIVRLLDLPTGEIQTVRIADANVVRQLISDHVAAGDERRLVFLPLGNVVTVGECVAQTISHLTALAASSWPVWFGDLDLSSFRDDPIGNAELEQKLRELRLVEPRISGAWVSQAARLAVRGLAPNPAPEDPVLQLSQVCLALSLAGVVLVIPFDSAFDRQRAAVAISATEWLARNAPAGILALIPSHWPDEPPVDRLLFRSWWLSADQEAAVSVPGVGTAPNQPDLADVRPLPDVSRIRGFPHPLSEVEQRIWAHLSTDEELAPLFSFNQTVVTIQGNRPRVDLLWSQGRVVIELDGYADHGTPTAFERDRHRDYELLLSGYRVLRITNEEVKRDLEAAICKIRDVVRLQRHGHRQEL